MKLLKLQVKGHKKYKLNPEMRHFTYTPEKYYQMLLGSNGAGKSTTASLLYPFPESKTVLEENGFVKQEYEYKGDIYKLTMENTEGHTRYSFMKGLEELNPAGKVTVQQGLVTEHFNITAMIQDVLTDRSKFTDMSAAEYKKWITMLSSTDYDFIFNMFILLKKKMSYVNNVLKHNNKKRAVEVEKTDDNDRDVLESNLKEKRKGLNILMDAKRHIDETEELQTVDHEPLLSLIRGVNEDLANSDLESIDTLYDTVDTVKIQISTAEAMKNDIYKKIETVNNDITEYFEMEDIPERSKLERTLALCNESLVKLEDVTVIDECDKMLTALDGIKDLITRELGGMNANEEYFTDAKLDENLKKYDKLMHDYNQMSDIFHKLELQVKELEHLKNHGKTQCPACSHEWYLKYDEVAHKALSEDLESKRSMIEKMLRTIRKREQYRDDGTAYMNKLAYFKNLRMTSRVLEDVMWHRLLPGKLIDANPSEASEYVKNVRTNLWNMNEKLRILSKKDETLKYLAMRDSLDNNNKDMATKTKKILEDQLVEKLDLIDHLKGRLSTYLSITDNVDRANRMKDDLKERINHSKVMSRRLYEGLVQDIVNAEIYKYKDKIYDIEQLLTRLDVSDRIIADIDSQLEVLNEEHRVLKITINELSPENGLIGFSLKDFLGNLVNNMNHYLDQVWTHSMEIHTPPVVRNKLTWKFPITIGDNDVPELNAMSSGEKNMVNLAFKLIMMHILNIGDYMLILDEFGTNLDTEHRNKAMRFVSETLREYDFSNIYVISHYSEAYKTFPASDTDYNVLHSTNIDIGGLNVSGMLVTH